MNTDHAARYLARFRKVLEHVEAHLDDELSVQRLSEVAAFSKYHFHRQFAGLLGITVFKYVQLQRLKRASHQLAFREQSSILEIALAAGYEGPEAFSRAFRKCIGQSPSQFREAPQWAPWHAVFQSTHELRVRHLYPTAPPPLDGEVGIVRVEAVPVALLAHRGAPRLIGDSVRSFIAWRKRNGLPPGRSATYNILHDDPGQVRPEDHRFDLAAAVPGEVSFNSFGVTSSTLPGGRCAVLRHIGSNDGLGRRIHSLYSEWLPRSGEEPRDFPVYLQRVDFFPDVAENEAVTDIFLPLR